MPVPQRASASPAVVAMGYQPEELDALLHRYLTQAEQFLKMGQSLTAQTENALKVIASADDPGWKTPAEAGEALTNWLDRLARAGANVVKALDQLSRLRSFLAGGPDSRPDLSSRGEQDLRRMLEETLSRMGHRMVPIDVTPGVPA
jgi:hypothetical protein